MIIYIELIENLKRISVKFINGGIPNPLEKEDSDITLSVEERQIGGLGIYMLKNSMDNIEYEYKSGQNIFVIQKIFVTKN